MKHKFACKKSFILMCGAAAVLLLFTGCTHWEKDFQKAKDRASSSGKGIFLLFSGDQWNEESVQFRKNVLNKGAFSKTLKKDYIFLNLDISSDEHNSAEGNEEKNSLLELYKVNSIPSVYFLNDDGCVLAVIPYTPDLDSPEAMNAAVEGKKAEIENLKTLFAEMKEASGSSKVKYIDSIFEATPETCRLPLESLLRQIPLIDPYNESKVLGKYELQLAYYNAIQRAENNDTEGLQNIFTDVCENGHLTGEEKQTAWYTAAFVLSSLNSEDYDTITKYLQNAYDSAPESENAETIREAIISVRQKAFTVKIMAMEAENSSGDGEAAPENADEAGTEVDAEVPVNAENAAQPEVPANSEVPANAEVPANPEVISE